MRSFDRLHPDRLHARAFEQLHRQVVGEAAEGARDDSGERLLVGRKTRLEPGLDVDVRVELVDERGRDLLPDLGIGDHLFGRVAHRRRVERLVADVAGDEGEHGDDEREDDKDPGGHHPPA